MSLDTPPPEAEAAEVGFQPMVQDATGDAASPEALGRLSRALARPTKTTAKQQKKPDETDVAQDLARLAQRLGYLEIAEKLLRKFLASHPGHIEASNNLACSLRDQKRYGEAIGVLQSMIALEPTSPILWNTVGTVMSDQGESAKALPFFEEALRLDPGFAKARYNRANVRFPLGDAAGALEDLEAAAAGAEGGYETAMMKMAHAMQLMAMGRVGEGFAAYDVRLDPALPDAVRPVIDAPRWDGATPLKGQRILVLGEQGLADEMVFGTCLPDLIDAVDPAGKVYISVEKRLVDMFQRSFPTAVVGAHRAVRLEGRLTRYVPFAEEAAKVDGRMDAYVPMGSLMAMFRPDIDSFPDREGYLVADPERVVRWTAWLDDLGPGLKIGLHWKSLVLTGVRARYFSSFERWSPVLTTPGCVMINLQCGDTEADLAEAAAAGVIIHTPPINLKDDLEDVAALSVALDLVIGPGIAGTNIAAAFGARTWMIHAPDDWHLLGTDHYPFYPRMRTFPTGGFTGWPGAIDRVRAALDKAVAGDWNTT
ncbi:MAG: tetratricopeptide repeat protein [Caulobacteraceae bacterium]|nr:MAG: tetratricopeptide repeat protein [Caulobacteraceae bacterium]